MSPAKPSFVIRDAGPLDVPLIAALHADCFTDGIGGEVWNEAAIAEVLAMPGAYGFLAAGRQGAGPKPVAGRMPAGFLLARAAAEACEILTLGVPPAWRRHGVARALLRAAIARARALGAVRTYLEVAEDNAAACRLYSAEGFTVKARRPAYYRRAAGRAAAALVLARHVA